jgi:acetyl-CoA carboxylase alpha subunit
MPAHKKPKKRIPGTRTPEELKELREKHGQVYYLLKRASKINPRMTTTERLKEIKIVNTLFESLRSGSHESQKAVEYLKKAKLKEMVELHKRIKRERVLRSHLDAQHQMIYAGVGAIMAFRLAPFNQRKARIKDVKELTEIINELIKKLRVEELTKTKQEERSRVQETLDAFMDLNWCIERNNKKAQEVIDSFN